MQSLIVSMLRDESGATAIEYGLIAGLIAAVIVTVLSLLGADLLALYAEIAAGIAGIG